MPTDRMAAKPLLLREASERSQRVQRPAVASREARDIMGAQNLIQRREGLVHLTGKKDSGR